MTIIYLGIIIVLLQSYMRLNIRHKDLFKEHIYMMENVLTDIAEVRKKCHKDNKSN